MLAPTLLLSLLALSLCCDPALFKDSSVFSLDTCCSIPEPLLFADDEDDAEKEDVMEACAVLGCLDGAGLDVVFLAAVDGGAVIMARKPRKSMRSSLDGSAAREINSSISSSLISILNVVRSKKTTSRRLRYPSLSTSNTLK